jgi:hypothetical protein
MCCSAGIIGPGTRTMVKYFWHPTVPQDQRETPRFAVPRFSHWLGVEGATFLLRSTPMTQDRFSMKISSNYNSNLWTYRTDEARGWEGRMDWRKRCWPIMKIAQSLSRERVLVGWCNAPRWAERRNIRPHHVPLILGIPFDAPRNQIAKESREPR